MRSLRPVLAGKVVKGVRVFREKSLRPGSVPEFRRKLIRSRFIDVSRRGKYLLFQLRSRGGGPFTVLGHLGMTGRMYLQKATAPLARHAAVVIDLGGDNFVFEDTRYFGRMTLETSPVAKLGPEPMSDELTQEYFRTALGRSSQPIKVKLLDQTVVAGIGNIYASEALFRAGISPKLSARRLTAPQLEALISAIRQVLEEAIAFGSTVPLNFTGSGKRDQLFYYGAKPGITNFYEERLLVYDRANQTCPRCKGVIKRMVQAGRSTYFCGRCQKSKIGKSRSG